MNLPKSYNIFRKDRSSSGGGVFTAVRNDLVAVEGKRFDVEGFEVITVSVNGDSNHQMTTCGHACMQVMFLVSFVTFALVSPTLFWAGTSTVEQLIGVPVTFTVKFQRMLAITSCWRLPTSLALRGM